MSITLEEAQRIVCENAAVVDHEMVPAVFCVGRILAEDVTAQMDQPPFPRSAMDGYAVRSEDTKGASAGHPVRLKVTGRIYAGDQTGEEVAPLEAVQIMTGGAIPKGADCVVRQEDTDRGTEEVEIYKESAPWMNYCQKGEDFHAGECLAEKGSPMDAYAIGAVSAAGIRELRVYRRIRAAIVTTGDELCMPGETLKSGKIYDSNMAYLMARLMQAGCEISGTYMAGDKKETICESVRKARENSDFIITTGGVSVGEKDLIPGVMELLGAENLFHGIAIKPGMPTMFSVLEGVPVLSLSGNPYSASTMFELLAQPLMAAMRGAKDNGLKVRTGILSNEFHKKSPRRRVLRGIYDGTNVRVPERQSNGQLKAGIGTNCFVDVPAGTGSLKTGERVKIFSLE